MADANWGVTVQYTGYSISLPAMHQIAPGGELVRINTRVNEQQIEAVLP